MTKDNTQDAEQASPAREAAGKSDVAQRSKRSRYWLVGAGSFAIVTLLFLSFSAGLTLQQRDANDIRMVRVASHREAKPLTDSYRDGGMRAGMMTPGGEQDTENTTHVAGVVTNVSGTTITVAGNGTTTTVEVSDNTTYRGSDEPAQVNDTIMARGATNSDDVLVASAIRLSRQ